MSQQMNISISVVGIDIGKNHVVGLDQRGAIVLRQKWSRSQVETRFANMPLCLVGMEACVGAHHLSRRLKGAMNSTKQGGHRPTKPVTQARRTPVGTC